MISERRGGFHWYLSTSLHASFSWRAIPAEVNPASYCMLKSDQSCTGESPSSWVKGLSRVSGSSRSKRSSWTRDRDPRFPESQPTVSAARPGDSSVERDNKVFNTGKYLVVLQHIANNDRTFVKLIFFCWAATSLSLWTVQKSIVRLSRSLFQPSLCHSGCTCTCMHECPGTGFTGQSQPSQHPPPVAAG